MFQSFRTIHHVRVGHCLRSVRHFAKKSSRGGTTSSIPPYVWFPLVGLTGSVLYGYYSCLEEVPLTHRKRWIATTPEWERQMGNDEYKKLLKSFKGRILPPQHRACRTVHRVGARLETACKEFCHEHPLAHMSPSPYTYTVVRDDDTANAFVLPNNHVFVLTGLFDYVKNEDDLAAVLGHELAHNLARHAGERVSGGVVMNITARLLFLIDPSGFLSAFFIPTAAVFHGLPNSRTAESEADQIGIYLAAKACYDPSAAKRVFAAMKDGLATKDGKTSVAPPEFISTHPSHDTRLSQFDDWMPNAMRVYESDAGYRCRTVRQDMKAARVLAAQQ